MNHQDLTPTDLVDLLAIDCTLDTTLLPIQIVQHAVRKFICSELRIKNIVQTSSRGCGSTVIDFAAGKAKKLNINKFEKAHQAGISPFQYCFSILFILFGAFFAAPVNFSLIL